MAIETTEAAELFERLRALIETESRRIAREQGMALLSEIFTRGSMIAANRDGLKLALDEAKAERATFFDAIALLTCPHLAAEAGAAGTLAGAAAVVVGYLDARRAEVERERDRLREACETACRALVAVNLEATPAGLSDYTRDEFVNVAIKDLRAALTEKGGAPS